MNNLEKHQTTKNIHINLCQLANEAESSLKKKLFMRKPCVNNVSIKSERKKITQQTPMEPVQMTIPSSETLNNVADSHESSQKINFVKRKQRQTQYFNKLKESGSQMSIRSNNNLFYSPKNSKKFIFDNLKSMQAYTPKASEMSGQNKFQTSAESKAQQINRQADKGINPFKNLAYRQKTTSITIPSFSFISQKSLSKYKNSGQPKTPSKYPKEKINSLIQQTINVQTAQCCYCKNSKEMINIINQKCSRLQQKLKEKNKLIDDCTSKIHSLQTMNYRLNRSYEETNELKEMKDIQLFNVKEEFYHRNQAVKIQLANVCERVKYVQIQNDILMRYKDQYGLIIKEYDMTIKENQMLKKFINQNKYEAQQNKHATIYLQNKGLETFKMQKYGANGQKRVDKQPIYNQNGQNGHHCEQAVSNKNGKGIKDKDLWDNSFAKEDDQISLTFSQKSYDQY